MSSRNADETVRLTTSTEWSRSQHSKDTCRTEKGPIGGAPRDQASRVQTEFPQAWDKRPPPPT